MSKEPKTSNVIPLRTNVWHKAKFKDGKWVCEVTKEPISLNLTTRQQSKGEKVVTYEDIKTLGLVKSLDYGFIVEDHVKNWSGRGKPPKIYWLYEIKVEIPKLKAFRHYFLKKHSCLRCDKGVNPCKAVGSIYVHRLNLTFFSMLNIFTPSGDLSEFVTLKKEPKQISQIEASKLLKSGRIYKKPLALIAGTPSVLV